ncbi:hypothetical protein OTERR_28220 [Oryzomicrobium terrae]|uniref:Serine aminopeptidase S33 domain-containing protein n=1 Tax=Oryzomicrobium terrae TaxID=1735038 RepID=A0A5C1EDD1_9RHOO|nr:hypothetical protein [Oryzomicrobium terrae]QEL66298.1 hypothetical protein OTERR_28220 [Oryzomicrobium terrae]
MASATPPLPGFLTAYAAPGPRAVNESDGEVPGLHPDAPLATRRYRPAGPLRGVIAYSHGLGGSCRSGAAWLRHWASHGFLGVALTHRHERPIDGSPLQLRRALREALAGKALRTRVSEMHALIAALVAALQPPPLETLVPIGVAGHSFGGVTTQILAGERRCYDPAPGEDEIAGPLYAPVAGLGAALAFSPSARANPLPLPERFAAVTAPFLSLTGSRDEGLLRGDIDAANRCLPFEHMPPGGKYLFVAAEGRHNDFAGEAEDNAGSPPAPAFTPWLSALSTAFWLAHLAGDSTARAALAGLAAAPQQAAPHRFAAK